MTKLAKSRAPLVAMILLLLLNLSFVILVGNHAQLKAGNSESGLSGPVVSFGQTTEALLFAAVKKTANYQSLKLFRRRFQRDTLLRLVIVALIFKVFPKRAIFKTNHSLKLEGG